MDWFIWWQSLALISRVREHLVANKKVGIFDTFGHASCLNLIRNTIYWCTTVTKTKTTTATTITATVGTANKTTRYSYLVKAGFLGDAWSRKICARCGLCPAGCIEENIWWGSEDKLINFSKLDNLIFFIFNPNVLLKFDRFITKSSHQKHIWPNGAIFG